MNILVLGGTNFFGKHLVTKLLSQGHVVSIATRGLAKDDFENKVNRITLDRTIEQSVKNALKGNFYDVICDNTCYSSNELKYVLENVNCNKYVLTSTGSVYDNFTLNLNESEFDPINNELLWCNRDEVPYGVGKQSAETALFDFYKKTRSAAIRFPYVVGTDDYTKRLFYYVNSIVKGIPMNVNNIDSLIPFIHSTDAGEFIAYLTNVDVCGVFNAGSGSISLKNIISYIEEKTKNTALFDSNEKDAPYNHSPSFSLNTDKAAASGYEFKPIDDWFWKVIDSMIIEAKSN